MFVRPPMAANVKPKNAYVHFMIEYLIARSHVVLIHIVTLLYLLSLGQWGGYYTFSLIMEKSCRILQSWL